ncbi:MAG: TrkH family potassium uptake protein [Alphaproteobacteria bacterium]
MIDFRPVFFVIGILLTTLAVVMCLPALIDAAWGNPDWAVFASSAAITLFVGVALILTNRRPRFSIEIREAFLLTTLAWVVAAGAGAMPFVFSELHLSFTDAYFEAMSGITTTGSTVIVGLDVLPPGILLWRSLLQLLGGIGFIVIAVAVLPLLRVGGMQLFRMEFSDKSEKVLPRAAQIASGIGVIYIAFVALCATAMWAAGMTGFEAVNHAMATLSTGGFSTSDGSIGHFRSPLIDGITIVFMLIGGAPFVLYLQAVQGRLSPLLRDSQVRTYLALFLAASVVLGAWRWLSGTDSLLHALREATFTVASIMTTTGFTTANYDLWGGFSACLILFLTAVGACTGSTAGGIKIYRLEVLYVTTIAQMRHLIHPHGMFLPAYNERPIPEQVAGSVMGFFFLFALVFSLLSFLLSALGLDFITSISAVATAMANVGPALGKIVGPAGNFASLPDAAKWLLSIGMLVGRLELFTVMVLFAPRFWRG